MGRTSNSTHWHCCNLGKACGGKYAHNWILDVFKNQQSKQKVDHGFDHWSFFLLQFLRFFLFLPVSSRFSPFFHQVNSSNLPPGIWHWLPWPCFLFTLISIFKFRISWSWRKSWMNLWKKAKRVNPNLEMGWISLVIFFKQTGGGSVTDGDTPSRLKHFHRFILTIHASAKPGFGSLYDHFWEQIFWGSTFNERVTELFVEQPRLQRVC